MPPLLPPDSFGLWVWSDAEATAYTLQAITAGITNFFASVLAYNQPGFAAAVRQSPVPRSSLFVCGSVSSVPDADAKLAN